MARSDLEATSVPPCWPLLEYSVSAKEKHPSNQPLYHGDNRPCEDPSSEPGVALTCSMAHAIPVFYPSIKETSTTKAQSYKLRSMASSFNTIPKVGYKQAAASLNTKRPRLQPRAVVYSEKDGTVSAAQLRGGADRSPIGLLGWFDRIEGADRKPEKFKHKKIAAVTYKGKDIGSPQPASALDVLPPASRFVRQLSDHTSPGCLPQSPLKNDYDINGNHVPTSRYTSKRTDIPPQPGPPPVTSCMTTQPRPVTTNPYANIYGNPNVIRASPNARSTGYARVGSLVDRPSALLGESQPGYYHKPAVHESLKAVPEDRTYSCSSWALSAQKARNNRKWDKLPALPREARTPWSPLDKEQSKEIGNELDEAFDTEKILKSLRPERLSLYIDVPGRPASSTDQSTLNSTAQQAISHDTRDAVTSEHPRISDDHSIRTREWDVQSCATEYLGVDIALQRQERSAQRVRRRPIPQQQPRQDNVRDNNESLTGLSEEPVLNPESAFYAELIDIVKHYHEQRRAAHEACEAGWMSKEEYKRQAWMYGIAMDQTVRAAASIIGYTVSTSLAQLTYLLQKLGL